METYIDVLIRLIKEEKYTEAEAELNKFLQWAEERGRKNMKKEILENQKPDPSKINYPETKGE